MDDVDLFWRIAEDRVTRADAAALAELAKQPVETRVAVLGVLDRVLGRDDPELRVAALSLLAGADGRLALSDLLRAFDDSEPSLRDAAIASFRESATNQPMRWAHALFHPSSSVRKRALEMGAPAGAESLEAFLLADPEQREVLWARAPTFKRDNVMLALTLEARGGLETDEAIALLTNVEADHVLAEAAGGVVRRPEAVKVLLELETAPDDPGRDGIDVLVSVILRASGEMRAKAARWLEPAIAKARELRRRVAASLIFVIERDGVESEELMRLLTVAYPYALAWKKRPLEIRRSAALALLAVRDHPRLQRSFAAALLEELVPQGYSLDLRIAAAVLGLVDERPFALLADTLGIERVVAAFAHAPLDAAILFSIHDESRRGRSWLISQIATRSSLSIGRLQALAVWILPPDRLDFLEKLEPHAALGVATALCDLETEPRALIKPKKMRSIATMLAHRLTDAAGDELARRLLTRLVAHLVHRAKSGTIDFGLALLGEIGRRIQAETFANALVALGDERLLAALSIVSAATRLPFGKELALAALLVDHPSEEIRIWARERAPGSRGDTGLLDAGTAIGTALPPVRIAALSRLSEADLERSMTPLIGIVHSGLTEALSRRPTPSAPSLLVCLALLGSTDPIDDVVRELERFRADTPAFLSELDALAVEKWSSHPELPLVGASWLWCWERQAFRVGRLVTEVEGGVVAALRAALELPSSLVRVHVFRAVGRVFEIWASRNREALAQAVGSDETPIVEIAVDNIRGDVGMGAAEILVAMNRAGYAAVRTSRARLFEALPDLDEDVRRRLDSIVSATGLLAAIAKRAEKRVLTPDERAEIRKSTDLDQLGALAAGSDLARAEEAILRLVELGSVESLALLLVSGSIPDAARVIAESVPLWPTGAALDRLRAAVDEFEPELRFRLSFAFFERGEAGAFERAIDAINAPAATGWFRYEDWMRLSRALPLVELAPLIATSPHPHAYRRAVEALMAMNPVDARAPLRAFLAAGTERLAELRMRVAEWLYAKGDDYGFPLRLVHALGGGRIEEALFSRDNPERVEIAVAGVLRTGARGGLEVKLCDLLEHKLTPKAARSEGYERLLLEATNLEIARRASNRLDRLESRNQKLGRVAEVFAWGNRIAPVITGRRLRVHMTAGRMLGYTRLAEGRIYVSPLPILRMDRNADEIVQGLVLHELGHHRHHAGPDGPPAWVKAEEERIFGLLNLVADEHLERNLRALDESFGNRFKKLAAYAFQHSDREIPVRAVLRVLGADSFLVLSTAGLSLAYAPDSVRVRSGALLAHMERFGSPFARFMRALRMGLGNRHADPVVAEALALFGRRFRHLDMNGLLEVARRLRSLFGWDAALAETFGGHEIGPGEERGHAIAGDNLEDEEVQREVERVIDPEHASRGSGGSGKPGKLWINVSGAAAFGRIHDVLPVPRDPAAHRAIAVEVARHSRKLRQFLHDLGVARIPMTRRLRGTRVDQGELERLVLRGDPRVLIRRELDVASDLFIGVAVDCSGSMGSGKSMDKAKRFAVLLAEAARGLPRVELRVFGFTDRVIYDAGDANHSAAASLSPHGGNNDAAGLLHVAEVAKRSQRAARLLVMVSDGLPTECSTQALKGLVDRLERRERMCVAQVAVRPLEEVCFRHYVLLEEGSLDRAVGEFGRTVVRLVRRAMA